MNARCSSCWGLPFPGYPLPFRQQPQNFRAKPALHLLRTLSLQEPRHQEPLRSGCLSFTTNQNEFPPFISLKNNKHKFYVINYHLFSPFPPPIRQVSLGWRVSTRKKRERQSNQYRDKTSFPPSLLPCLRAPAYPRQTAVLPSTRHIPFSSLVAWRGDCPSSSAMPFNRVVEWYIALSHQYQYSSLFLSPPSPPPPPRGRLPP